MVPEGWKHGFVKDLANTVMGYAFKSTDFVPDGIPLLRMGNLYQNMLDLERNPVFLPKRYLSDFSRFIVRPGDLVMSMTGTMGKRDYGFTVQIPDSVPELLLNQRVMKFEPKKDACLEYLLNLFRSEIFLNYLYSFPGGTKQANLSAKQVQVLPVLIPPKAEQKKIAKILSTWDKAITTTEQLLTNSQQQKKALMQQLLTGEKRLAGFKQAWSKVKVSKMGSISSGGTPDTTKKEYWDGGINWLTPTDVTSLKSRYVFSTNKTISEKGLKNSSAKMLPRGALLICTRATIGAMAISTTEIATNQGFKNLVPNAEFSVEFLYYLFTFNVKELVRRSSGSTFLELSKSDFEKLTFLCPCLDEQHKIASVLIAADDEVSVQQQKLNNLKQEKKALMQQLLTGKRRVKVEAA
ncbi:restriction endonuclease subunit S [Yersinia enterocolitica]|uniref:restriction endonuclease subunit S n=1 Tax=Yersinia enterocolitica TaxID=630 RepID=UPI002A4E0BA7|nr:restriction endonuclease subunit S [Yersinia enterocolitica]EKN6391467.1 restriction endonuclease subunit S [Yersinia enterocolitica]HEN3463967.1 restriction endonuclease subunit S [Yersinia enterocolitica]